MMRHVIWIAVAWFTSVLFTALAHVFHIAHLVPDAAVIIAVFLAFEREAPALVASCVAIGALIGRQALAPTGLHEWSLATVALSIHLVAGNIAGSGRLFFATSVAGATIAYQMTMFCLLWLVRGEAGFPNWTTAVLLPNAMLNALVGWLVHPVLLAVERRLSSEHRESLSF